jgi:hypothetical protein
MQDAGEVLLPLGVVAHLPLTALGAEVTVSLVPRTLSLDQLEIRRDDLGLLFQVRRVGETGFIMDLPILFQPAEITGGRDLFLACAALVKDSLEELHESPDLREEFPSLGERDVFVPSILWDGETLAARPEVDVAGLTFGEAYELGRAIVQQVYDAARRLDRLTAGITYPIVLDALDSHLLLSALRPSERVDGEWQGFVQAFMEDEATDPSGPASQVILQAQPHGGHGIPGVLVTAARRTDEDPTLSIVYVGERAVAPVSQHPWKLIEVMDGRSVVRMPEALVAGLEVEELPKTAWIGTITPSDGGLLPIGLSGCSHGHPISMAMLSVAATPALQDFLAAVEDVARAGSPCDGYVPGVASAEGGDAFDDELAVDDEYGAIDAQSQRERMISESSEGARDAVEELHRRWLAAADRVPVDGGTVDLVGIVSLPTETRYVYAVHLHRQSVAGALTTAGTVHASLVRAIGED